MKSNQWYRLAVIVFVAVILLAILPLSVLAQETTPAASSLEISSNYPKLEVKSGDTASFSITLNYTNEGAESKEFDLIVSTPDKWTSTITNSTGQKIAAVVLSSGVPNIISLNVMPSGSYLPDAGDYPVTLLATSGDVQAAISLNVIVTAKYDLQLVPGGSKGLYSMTAAAGKTNVYSVSLVNNSSAPVNNIIFSSDKPTDWQIDFPQNGISSLAAGATENMDVKIIIPADTVAGDYAVTLNAKGSEISAPALQVRVNVEVSSVWSWVGLIIIIIVVIGLGFVFLRFSRR